MFEKELKNQPTNKSILLVLLIIFSIFHQVVFVSAAPFKVPIFSIFSINPSELNEVASGNNRKIDKMILSQEVKTVTKETSKSKRPNLLKRQMVIQAREDLSERLSVEIDQIKLLEAREVTWPDSSLGCPQPGKVYNPVPQDGLLIRLEAGGRMYFYHSAGTLKPFLCEESSQIVPHPTRGDEFVPPPGSEID